MKNKTNQIGRKVLLTVVVLFALFFIIAAPHVVKTMVNDVDPDTAPQTAVYQQAAKHKTQKQFIKITVSEPGFLNIPRQTTLIAYANSTNAIEQLPSYVQKHHQLPVDSKYMYYDLKDGKQLIQQTTYNSDCTFQITAPMTGQHFITLVNQPDDTDLFLNKFNLASNDIWGLLVSMFAMAGLVVIWKPHFIMQYIES